MQLCILIKKFIQIKHEKESLGELTRWFGQIRLFFLFFG